MNIIDELTVPQPPYRMKRPEAVLAANTEDPVIASTEGEVLPTPEAPSPALEREQVSVAEAVAEAAAAMEASAEAGQAQIEQTPAFANAAPEEAQEDDKNRQAAVGQVKSATAEALSGAQRVAERTYDTPDELEQERDRLMAIAQAEGVDSKRGKLAAKGAILLGPMIARRRAQTQLVVEQPAPVPPAEAPTAPQEAKVPVSQMKKREGESDGEFVQRKYDEKTPAKQKEEETRAQKSAIAEDAARDAQKMETPEGLKFEQSQETAAQKAGRIGREALGKLNDFKSLQEKKGVSPEQLEFARQQANLAQKRAEAAKRGEKIPEDRVDMAKVEAAGTPEGRDAAMNERLKELMKVAQDAAEAGDKDGASAAAREFMKVRSERIRLRTQREDAAAANAAPIAAEAPVSAAPATEMPSVESQNIGVVKPDSEQGQRIAEVQRVAEAQNVKENLDGFTKDQLLKMAQVEQTKEAAGGKMDQAYIDRLLAKAQEKSKKKEPAVSAEEEMYDAEGNLNLVPLVYPPGTPLEGQPLNQAEKQRVHPPGTPLEGQPLSSEAPSIESQNVGVIRPDSEEGRRVAEARAAAEQVAAAPAEAAPAVAAERAPTAEERIAQLENEIAQLKAERRQAAPEARVEQREAPAEGGAEAAIRASIGEQLLKEKEKPSWFGQEWLKIQADGHNIARYWNSIWAKRAKDTLVEQKTRLAELEKEAAAYSAKSWQNTAWAALKYAPRINWYKRSIEGVSTTLERREDERKRHEDARAELLNLTVAREDASRKASEAEAGRYQEDVNIVDGRITKFYDKHREATQAYADSTDPLKKQELLEEIAKIERLLRGAMQMRAEAQRKFSEQNAEAAQKQANQNKLLGLIDMPEQPDTSAGERRKEEVRKRPKRAKAA